MVNFPGRNGRRRRVLNEEVLSGSNALAARQSAAGATASANAHRYSDAAGVENHPQVTDFIPRRYGTIVMLVLAGVATTATLGALHYFAPTVAGFAGLPTLRPFDIGAPGSVAAWVSSVVLFLASATCLLVYSIRRHRIDDYRGRYRVWLGAAVACLVLSANCVTGLQQVIAYSLSNVVGWTALRDNSVWWLAIAGPPLIWIVLRAAFDVRECRVAAIFIGAAGICYTASAAGYFGVIPTRDSQQASLITGVCAILGHWFIFSSVISYARFVVLDAQGLVAGRKPAAKKQKQAKQQPKAEPVKPARESKPEETKATVLSVVNYARTKASQTPAADDDRWVDGKRPERKSYKEYDDDVEEEDDASGDSKLSKSDRKKLRKLKAQNRAA